MAGGGQTSAPNPYTSSGPQAAAALGNAIPGGNASYIANALQSANVGGSSGQNLPPWLRGLQMGQQLAQMSQPQQRPLAPPMQPRPMMGTGMPGGMPQGVVPGVQGMAPPMPSQAPGMMNGNMGLSPNMGPQGNINPQLLQLLRQRGLMG